VRFGIAAIRLFSKSLFFPISLPQYDWNWKANEKKDTIDNVSKVYEMPFRNASTKPVEAPTRPTKIAQIKKRERYRCAISYTNVAWKRKRIIPT